MRNDIECPGPDCLACNGEACRLCGAGCWNNAPEEVCEHDVTERHMEKTTTEPESKPDDLPAWAVELAQDFYLRVHGSAELRDVRELARLLLDVAEETMNAMVEAWRRLERGR